MEVLRKYLTTLLISFISFNVSAQQDAKLQAAFKESYSQETNKQYASAIATLKAVYEEKSYELNLRIGWLYYLNNDYPQSQTYYQKAVNLRPYAIEAKFGLLKPLISLQNWDKALQLYEDILNIDPQNTIAGYWAGIIYYYRRKYEQAAKLFEKVVNLYPFDYDGNHMLAWTYLNLGRSNDAKILFNKALLAKPGDASCLEGLGKIR
ncbi:MAG: tetratricopeptide repeat protein [Chitinophagaceae bacterium]|nr:tetratricopeptide repeat protein [Chitinophagaceae bacterium]MBK8951962.1 tetratricopeptide repeat protein [Chitinophagaceae bacterium]